MGTVMTLKNRLRRMVLKGCTRCRGDMSWDEMEREYCCVQCGNRLTMKELEKADAERLFDEFIG